MSNEFKDNKITIIDENNNEHLMEILFTYEHEQRNKKYVFFYDPNSEEDIVVMSYDDEGNLYPIENDDEYAEVEEVFNAYNEDPEINKIK